MNYSKQIKDNNITIAIATTLTKINPKKRQKLSKKNNINVNVYNIYTIDARKDYPQYCNLIIIITIKVTALLMITGIMTVVLVIIQIIIVIITVAL